MWGEIEPRRPVVIPVFDQVFNHEAEDEDKMEPVPSLSSDAETQHLESPSIPTSSASNEEESSSLSAMIAAIVASGSPVKSQQLGEPDLTVKEKKQVLMEQYNAKPVVFLERYHTHLKPEHLEAFSHVSDDCRTQYYCTEVQKRASSLTKKKIVRNHRYAALRALEDEGQYFSEEQMRFREPLLYEQYIGQYLSDEDLLQRSEESMKNGPTCFSDLLIKSYHEKILQTRIQEEQDREDCEEQEDEEEKAECREDTWEPTEEEKALLREEFLTQMHQRFLDGKDKDFNYSEVDENPDYDNLDIVSQDAEERYFDGDDNGEEEEEEEEDDDDDDNTMV